MDKKAAKEQILYEYMSMHQYCDEIDEILKKFKGSLIASIAAMIIFYALFSALAIIRTRIGLSVVFLIWVAVAILICYMFSGKYMFVRFIRFTVKFSKIPVLGLILTILCFAVWFLLLILLPVVNIISVKKCMLTQYNSFKETIANLDANPDFQKIKSAK